MSALRGFTLIEVAIVTVVLTLLLGGLLIPLAAQVDQRRYSETNKSLSEIKDALIGFAQVNGRLPCPATAASSGQEGNPPVCAGLEGDLPWVTLNVPPNDAWGHRFRYRVAANMVAPQPWPAGFATTADLVIQAASKNGTPVLANNAAAVILSHGKNGFGAAGLNAAPAGTDEAKNSDGAAGGTSPADRTLFVSRTQTATTAGCSDTVDASPFCEFDDVVIWISPFVLFNRMDQAGNFIIN